MWILRRLDTRTLGQGNECTVEPKVHMGDRRIVGLHQVDGAVWVLGVDWVLAFFTLFSDFMRKCREMKPPRCVLLLSDSSLFNFPLGTSFI